MRNPHPNSNFFGNAALPDEPRAVSVSETGERHTLHLQELLQRTPRNVRRRSCTNLCKKRLSKGLQIRQPRSKSCKGPKHKYCRSATPRPSAGSCVALKRSTGTQTKNIRFTEQICHPNCASRHIGYAGDCGDGPLLAPLNRKAGQSMNKP